MSGQTYTRVQDFSEESRAAVVECLRILLGIPPEDRLDAVVVIARTWTDIADFRERISKEVSHA